MNAKKTFENPFIGTSISEDVTILFSRDGNYSVVLSIENKAIQYGSDPRDYEEYHQLLGQCIKVLGPQFILQKTDIIARKSYTPPAAETPWDYLQEKYFSILQAVL